MGKLPSPRTIRSLIYALCAVLMLGGGAYMTFFYQAKPLPVRTIALLSRFSDDQNLGLQSQSSLMSRYSLELLIEEHNQKNPHHELRLACYDTRSNPKVADSLYQALAADSNIVLFVDNGWGVDLRECAATIKKHRLPVLTLNGDHNRLDFGPTVLFHGADDGIPGYLLRYIKLALADTTFDLISEVDYPLHEVFLHATEEQGMRIEHTFEMNSQMTEGEIRKALAKIEAYYRAHPGRIVVFNLHNQLGDRVLRKLEKGGRNLQILGSAYVVNEYSSEDFGTRTGNRLYLLSRPMDAVSKVLHDELETLVARHDTIFDHKYANLFTRRAHNAMLFLHEAVPEGELPTRHHFQHFFAAQREQTLVTQTDIFSHDKFGAMQRDQVFTMLEDGRLHSAPQQLSGEGTVVPNLFFGMEIQDIYDLDVTSNSFSSDFYYWVKVDTANKDAVELLSFQNMKQSESSRELIIEELHGTILYRLYRVSGKFFVNYQLHDFPFDHQEIEIIVESLRPTSDLLISFDESSYRADKSVFESFKVPGWAKEKYYVTVNNNISNTMRGDPKLAGEKAREYKNFHFSLQVGRKPLSGILKIVLPLTLISLISIALLYIKDLTFGNIGEVAVGTFLGIIAFSISLTETTPSTSYLTKADLLFWLSFVVVFVCFMVTIVLNSLFDRAQVRRTSIKGLKMSVTILYPLLVFYILWM